MSPTLGHVLVLDDDDLVGATVGMIAQDAGYEATVTNRFDAFWGALDAVRPSHVTLDLSMPEVDGIEVLRRLADHGYAGSVIISSGLDRRVLEAAHRSAVEHGLHLAGVLPKPFRPADLRELLAVRPTAAAPRPAANVTPDAAALRRGLAGGHVEVAFQPKVRCRDGAIVGYEALARWHDPVLGTVPPDVFVRLAEAEGLIGALTERVFDLALGWIARREGEPTAHVSLNLSARSLGDLEVLDALNALCAMHGVAPARVVLELTETASSDDEVMALDVLTRLRIKGCALSIDDFGTGHSTLVQLARQPFSELKIDRRFVGSLATSRESRTIVRAMVGLAHGLGLTVTAEGVEDAEALAFLAEVGCDHAQGYHVGRPLAPAQVDAWREAYERARRERS